MDINNFYDSQAENIDVDDIATNSNNRIVLRRLRRNEARVDDDVLCIQNYHYAHGDELIDSEYFPERANDMGWLGYFAGKHQHLQQLSVTSFEPLFGLSVRDVLGPFFRGVSCNKSIRQVDFYHMDLLGGEVFTMLGSFFKDNHNLTEINIEECDFGDEGGSLFALAIGNITHKSLEKVVLDANDISKEGMVDIITALRVHRHLEHLSLHGNLSLDKNGCVALAALLQCSLTELQYLDISNNDIDDEGIEALVPALENCSQLKTIYLSKNPLITTRGWQSLASILESPTSNLEILGVELNRIDNEAAAAFANALLSNNKLHRIYLDNNPSITANGWEAFTKLLCNTSSINSTFLSNHTLWCVGNIRGIAHENIVPILQLNEKVDKEEVATIKILQTHVDFDMLPFFEWEFKVLPLVLGWLERASECEMPDDFEPNIEPRKLSTIYQFVRGMPLLYVETRMRKELADIKAEEKQMEEDQRRLLQEFQQRKQYLQERKDIIMKNLGVGGNLQI